MKNLICSIFILFLTLFSGPGLVLAQDSPLEIFIRGKKYQSVGEYRKNREEAILKGFEEAAELEMQDEAASHEVLDPGYVLQGESVDHFLDMTLENFTDQQIEMLVRKLKDKRKDLFKENSFYPDQSFIQAKKMLSQYIDMHQKDVDIDLDASLMKTIVLEPKKEEAPKDILPVGSRRLSFKPKFPLPQRGKRPLDTSYFLHKDDLNDALGFKTLLNYYKY